MCSSCAPVGRDLALSDGPIAGANKRLITAVDAWENVWFDVADAALARSFPEIHTKVLDKLAKTSGPMVLLNVKALLDRLDVLEKSGDPNDAAALALLAKRGLNSEERGRAAALINQARTGEADESDDAASKDADLDEATAQMWAWYRDWAKTARTVIASKRVRIMMGLSAATRADGEVAEVELDDEDEDDTAGA